MAEYDEVDDNFVFSGYTSVRASAADLDSIYELWARLAKIADYLKAVLPCPY